MSFHSKKRFESWLPALFDGEFDWDFLNPAWKGTKIRPMDFDAVIERRGHFLIYETKIPGKKIDLGQAITLTEQWKRGSTIFVLAGKSPKEISGYAIYPETQCGQATSSKIKIGDKTIIEGDATDVLYRARCWFCWASGWDVPTRAEWDR